MQLLRNFETSLISFSLSFQKQQDSFTKSYFFRPDTHTKKKKLKSAAKGIEFSLRQFSIHGKRNCNRPKPN